MIMDQVVIGHEKTFAEIDVMQHWLIDNLGCSALTRDHVTESDRRWVVDRQFGHWVVFFATEEDAMWFKMTFNYLD